jgi:hypothetical protein
MNKTNRLFCLFVIVMSMFAWPTDQASAMLVKCRFDPHFLLSNGDKVTVTLDISTDIANVRNIHYILHVPAGVTLNSVVYTARAERSTVNETYVVYQDSPTRTYTTDTIVTTYTGKVAVTVYTRLNTLSDRAVSGYSGQHLVTTVSRR